MLLALYLVSEVHLGDESFFGPYIKILPDTFDSPLFWGAEELRRLNGSPLLGMHPRCGASRHRSPATHTQPRR